MLSSVVMFSTLPSHWVCTIQPQMAQLPRPLWPEKACSLAEKFQSAQSHQSGAQFIILLKVIRATYLVRNFRGVCGGRKPDSGMQSRQGVSSLRCAEMRGGVLHRRSAGELPYQAAAEPAPAFQAPQPHLQVLRLPLEVRSML